MSATRRAVYSIRSDDSRSPQRGLSWPRTQPRCRASYASGARGGRERDRGRRRANRKFDPEPCIVSRSDGLGRRPRRATRSPRFLSQVVRIMAFRRGDIHWIAFPDRDPAGSEIEKKRPGVIMSRTKANEFRRTVVVVPLTRGSRELPPIVIAIPSVRRRQKGGLRPDLRCGQDEGLARRIGSLTDTATRPPRPKPAKSFEPQTQALRRQRLVQKRLELRRMFRHRAGGGRGRSRPPDIARAHRRAADLR